MVTNDLKKIENKGVRDDIAHDINSIKKLKYFSEFRKKDLIKDLLDAKQKTQDYDVREKLADAIEFEDSPFRVLDITGWTDDEKKCGEGTVKVKINDKKDVMDVVEGPWMGRQFFFNDEALFREISKAKGGISQKEIEEKYILTENDLLLKAGEKRQKNEKYTKLFTTYFEKNLSGYFDPDYDKFIEMGKAFFLLLPGGESRSARFDKNGWSDGSLRRKVRFSCYLKKGIVGNEKEKTTHIKNVDNFYTGEIKLHDGKEYNILDTAKLVDFFGENDSATFGKKTMPTLIRKAVAGEKIQTFTKNAQGEYVPETEIVAKEGQYVFQNVNDSKDTFIPQDANIMNEYDMVDNVVGDEFMPFIRKSNPSRLLVGIIKKPTMIIVKSWGNAEQYLDEGATLKLEESGDKKEVTGINAGGFEAWSITDQKGNIINK